MFKLEIQTGNRAMQTADDLASELRTIAMRLDYGHTAGAVIDGNGDTVGSWEMTED